MSPIILPPIALYNAERERLTSRHAELRWFDDQLKAFDPNMDLVRVSEQAGGVNMRPGFWHVRRTDPTTGWQHYMVIEGPDGQFMEPHAGVIEWLRGYDLHREGAFEGMLKQLDAKDRAKERDTARWRDALKEEYAERYANKTRASVSMSNQGRGWKNRAYAQAA